MVCFLMEYFVGKRGLTVSLQAGTSPGRCDTWLPIPGPESVSLSTQSETAGTHLHSGLILSHSRMNWEYRSTQAEVVGCVSTLF